jgi:hypothetical protein
VGFKTLRRYENADHSLLITDDDVVRLKQKGGKWSLVGPWRMKGFSDPEVLSYIDHQLLRTGWERNRDKETR